MEVVLYQLSKRNKSSLRPSGEGLALNLQLKDECDLEHPEFVFDFEPTNYNYCYIPTWNRYYFKGEQQYFHGRWFVKFNEDYLATWLTDIRNTKAYVLYDNIQNNLVDKRLVTIPTPSITNDVTYPIRSDFNSPINWIGVDGLPLGHFYVTTTGEHEVTTYSCTGADLKNLMVNYSTWFSGFIPPNASTEDVLTAFVKNVAGTGVANNNIHSVIFIPDNASPAGTTKLIQLGLYQTSVQAEDIGLNNITTGECQLTIPWQVDDWRRNSPFTQIYVFVPFVGLVHYNASDIINDDTIYIRSNLNHTTGDMTIRVETDSILLGIYSANAGVNIPLGASGFNPVSIGTTILKNSVGLGLSAATGGAFGATATMLNAASGILGDIEVMDDTIGGLGNGTSIPYSLAARIWVEYHDTIVNPADGIDIIGYPTNFVRSLTNASGFIQTAGFQLGGIATAPEKDAVNALMDSGVYLE